MMKRIDEEPPMAPGKAACPFFSIVVPTRRRPRQLQDCMISLALLDYDRDRFEIIVVADGDRARMQWHQVPNADRLHLKMVFQDRSGPAVARNSGAAKADGEFLAFTDDDCTVRADWLRRMASRLGESPGDAVCGRTLNRLTANPFSTASQMLIDYLMHYFNRLPAKASFGTSNNLALAAADFHEIGGFDPDFGIVGGEDREFIHRWLFSGRRLTFASEALVDHRHQLSLPAFWRQHFSYGRGAYRYRCKCRQRKTADPKMEPLSFYTGMLRFPFRVGRSLVLAALISTLLVLAQTANAAGFFREKIAAHGGR